MSAAAMSLDARGLSIFYGARPIIEGADIEARAGAVSFVLGGNGSGKTTLLKSCVGLLPIASGVVRLHGARIDGLNSIERAKRVAYLPQAHRPSFPFPVREVVLMGRWPHASPMRGYSDDDRAAAMRALGQVGVEKLADRPYTELSGGERQLVLIARALAQEAGVLVLDEPETGLDVGRRQRLMALLRQLADQGRAVLLSSHFPDNALLFADHVALLADNRVIASGAPGEVVTKERLWKVYGVEVALPLATRGANLAAPTGN